MLAAAFPILPVLILIVVITFIVVVGLLIYQVWDKQPWWRTSPKPRKQLKNAKERIKIYKLQMKNPDAFINPEPPPPPQPLSPVEQEVVDDIVKDVVDKDKHL